MASLPLAERETPLPGHALDELSDVLECDLHLGERQGAPSRDCLERGAGQPVFDRLGLLGRASQPALRESTLSAGIRMRHVAPLPFETRALPRCEASPRQRNRAHSPEKLGRGATGCASGVTSIRRFRCVTGVARDDGNYSGARVPWSQCPNRVREASAPW